MGLKHITFLFLFLFSGLHLMSQTKVSGTIIDAESNEPLIWASVHAPNTNEGTTTDIDGFFEFTTTDTILTISYTGYKSTQISIDPSLPETALHLELQLHPESLICICVIVTRAKHKIHPSVTYLKSRDIQINNDVSIAPALNMIPGVFMHSGALNTNRITIRGIGNRNLFGTAKIKAYLDGIPLTNGSGETTIEDIDLSILDAVTVYKGPASSIYGAGLGGMISLQVDDDLDRNGTTFSIANTGGSYGLTRNVFSLTKANRDKNILQLNVNRTHSDGYRANNEYERLSFSGYGKFKLNEQETLNFFGNYTFLDAHIPSSLDSIDYADNPRNAAFIWDRAKGYEKTKKLIAGASYQSSIGDHFRQISSLYTTSRESYEPRPFNILKEIAIIKA